MALRPLTLGQRLGLKSTSDRDYNRVRRDKAVAEVHNSSRWHRLAALYRATHPLCEECQRQGRETIATTTNHRVPVRVLLKTRGREACFDVTNLEALCDPCDSASQRKETALYGGTDRTGT